MKLERGQPGGVEQGFLDILGRMRNWRERLYGGSLQGPYSLAWGWGRTCLPVALSCPASIDWGLCLPTSGEPGLQGADRFSPLPSNCKSCWLLLGASWGGPRREDQLSNVGRGWRGKRPA